MYFAEKQSHEMVSAARRDVTDYRVPNTSSHFYVPLDDTQQHDRVKHTTTIRGQSIVLP